MNQILRKGKKNLAMKKNDDKTYTIEGHLILNLIFFDTFLIFDIETGKSY